VFARLAPVGASLLLAGCMVGPSYKRPPLVPPEAFKSQAISAPTPPIEGEWWRLYGDPDLDRLIDTAAPAEMTAAPAVPRKLRLASARGRAERAKSGKLPMHTT